MPELRDPILKTWDLREYHQLEKSGVFAGKRIQLIEGRIVELNPMGPRHMVAVRRTTHALEQAIQGNHIVFSQSPLALDLKQAYSNGRRA